LVGLAAIARSAGTLGTLLREPRRRRPDGAIELIDATMSPGSQKLTIHSRRWLSGAEITTVPRRTT
jgi:hypothetical protein